MWVSCRLSWQLLHLVTLTYPMWISAALHVLHRKKIKLILNIIYMTSSLSLPIIIINVFTSLISFLITWSVSAPLLKSLHILVYYKAGACHGFSFIGNEVNILPKELTVYACPCMLYVQWLCHMHCSLVDLGWNNSLQPSLCWPTLVHTYMYIHV